MIKVKEYRGHIRNWEALCEELGIDKFGVIRVGRFAGDDRDQEIIDAQEAVCENGDDFLLLTHACRR